MHVRHNRLGWPNVVVCTVAAAQDWARAPEEVSEVWIFFYDIEWSILTKIKEKYPPSKLRIFESDEEFNEYLEYLS